MANEFKGVPLVKRTTNSASDALIKSWTTDAFIPAGGFYLWANSGYMDISASPDSTTSATLSDDNAIALRYGGSDTGVVIDSVAWGKSQNSFQTAAVFSSSSSATVFPFPINPSANQSLLRKSWQNGACTAVSLDPSIGNGCDTGNNAEDFEFIQGLGARDSRTE